MGEKARKVFAIFENDNLSAQAGSVAQKGRTRVSGSDQVLRISSMHMAQILASVTGEILTRLSPDLRQPMFEMLCATALENVEHVTSSHPEAVKRQVITLTRIYVMRALKSVAAEMNLQIPTSTPVASAA